jgi:predicted ribosome quality control (RQC) complex YloA/Tae2 family protein
LEIHLDPEHSLGENAQRLFQRARKLKRGQPRIKEQIAKSIQQKNDLEELEGLVSRAADFQALEAAAEQVQLKAPCKKRQGAKRGKHEAQDTRKPYRCYLSQSGSEIWVGKGARDNDELSLRLARGNDLWFHAEDQAGAHVVLRSPRGKEPDGESVLDAATLAAHFSRGRKSGESEVLTTRCVNVRKPKGARPGSVVATHTRAIYVRIESKRLQRLLSPSHEQ